MIGEAVILLVLAGLMLLYQSFFLRLVLLINLYPIVVLFSYKNGFPIIGLLTSIGGDYYTEEILNSAFTWQILGYVTMVLCFLPIRKVKPEWLTIQVATISRVILLVFVIVFAMIAYPGAFHLSDKRFNLLPGNGWGSLYLTFTVLFILSKNKTDLIDKLHVAFVLLMIILGNRADNILILVFLWIYKFQGNKSYGENYTLSKLIIPFAALFVLGVLIGLLRFNAFEWNLVLSTVLMSLYGQATAVDAVHTYLSSVWYYFNYSPDWSVFINTPMTFLPGTPFGGVASEYNFTVLLQKHIYNNGGGLFYGEGAMNLGLFGVVLYTIIFCLLIRLVISHKSILNSVLFILVFIIQLRLQWYGLLYIAKPLILIFGILFIIWLMHYGHLRFKMYRYSK